MNTPNREHSLRDQYALHIEIGLSLALAVLILAFQIDLDADQSFTVAMQEQESVEVTEIQQTRQENEPPPPPKPPVPQEVPNNQVVEQQPLTSMHRWTWTSDWTPARPRPLQGTRTRTKRRWWRP